MTLFLNEPSSVALADISDPFGERRKNARDESIKSRPGFVRLLVVDDHEIVRKAICDLLKREKGFDVICEASNGLQAIEAAERLRPDVVVLDVTMPALGGIEAAARIRGVAPKSRIIFLSQHNLKKLAEAALATGAHGYVLKSAAARDLVRAIRAALAGEKFMSDLDAGR
jgi:DNA-binding NarL/FixJ family response regulator